VPDSIYNVGGINTRRVTGRNAPSAINAVFNFRNFWDGRASNEFNGVNPFGARDPNKPAIYRTINGKLTEQSVLIPFSSLASQAVGPPGSDFEMSCAGRIFPDMARKMLSVVPLGQQKVSPTDSVLGGLVNRDEDNKGLRTSYEKMIQKAFKADLWNNTTQLTQLGTNSTAVKSQKSDDLVEIGDDGTVRKEKDDNERREKVVLPANKYRQIEMNFSLFWGLAIQMYEATLVSDDTPVDRYLAGDATALNDSQKRGLELFEGKAKCAACHSGAETTSASVRNTVNERLERMHMGDGNVKVYDNGFYNTAVRPTQEDLAVGGTDPFGKPLSEVAYCQSFMQKGQACPLRNLTESGQLESSRISDTIQPRPDEVGISTAPLGANEPINVNGAFKTPGLRNVELTGPYMHNGGMSTLRQVVDFYNRGGDFADQNRANLDPNMEPLGLSDNEKADLVEFMIALTDPRVKKEAAPFDHPQLCIPVGEQADGSSLKTGDTNRQARDEMTCLPAVGEDGGSNLKPFLDLNPRAAQ
jgi:cytochrome c peroxidase